MTDYKCETFFAPLIRWINLPSTDGSDQFWKVDSIRWFTDADGATEFDCEGDQPGRTYRTTLPIDEFIKRLTGEEEK